VVQSRKTSLALRLGAVLLVVAVVEAAIRLSGITDFPAYAVDDELGYVVKPNQSGHFLVKNSWSFNSKSMPTAVEWNPSAHPNILLIGNSIVMGGNPYDQQDKLTTMLTSNLGGAYQIWPAAIGGWTNVNEMAYLRRNPDVVKVANFFVWEYMSGGLSGPNSWAGDYVFPSYRPVWATGYVFRRYVLPHVINLKLNELPPVGDLKDNYLKDFETSIAELSRSSKLPHPGLIFLYPTKKELLFAKQAGEWLHEKAALVKVCDEFGLKLIDVAANEAWNASLYRDSVHPTVQGNAVLATILSSAIAETLAPPSQRSSR